MFCPACGRDNSLAVKFCASCGTNLEVISRALSVREEGLLARADRSLDQFIARYAEHLFKDASTRARDRKIGKSWRVLGQGVLTSLFDLALFSIMMLLLPIRFFTLLFYTPIKLLSERSKHQRSTPAEVEGKKAPDLFDPLPQPWLSETVTSVTEHTTVNLTNPGAPQKRSRLKTDSLNEDRA